MNFRRFLILLIFLLRLYPSLVRADDFRVVPSVAFKEEYNTNILLSVDDVERDFITTLSPGIEIVDRTDRLETDLLARFDRLDYSNHRNLNATNQTYSGTFKYVASPLSHVSVGGGYLKDYNPSLEAGLPATGFTEVKDNTSNGSNNASDNTSNNNGGNGNNYSNNSSMPPQLPPVVAVPVNEITSSLSADYSFTEKAAAAMSYNYARNYYKDIRYQDGTSHNVNVGFVYDLGQYLSRVKGRMNAGYSHYDFPDSLVESVMGTAGFSLDLDQVWSIQVDGGIRRTWSEIWIPLAVQTNDQVVNGQEILTYTYEKERLNNRSWGKVGSASLHYQGEYVACDLAYVRDITMASGLNGAAERNAATFSAGYRLTYELSASFTTGYSTLRSDSSNFSPYVINQRTFTVGQGLRYEFSKDAALEAAYSYTRVEGTASYTAANAAPSASYTEAGRHLTFIRLYIQHALLE